MTEQYTISSLKNDLTLSKQPIDRIKIILKELNMSRMEHEAKLLSS